MKVSNIIRDIEYIVPKGALDKYKYGVKVQRSSAVKKESNPDFFEPSIAELKRELKQPLKVTKPLEPEIVGE